VTRLGVIADTHGLLRPEAVAKLEGCDLIIHAGDVGSPEILATLKALAPTYAVRGNVDNAPWCYRMPLSQVIEVEEVQLYVYHGHQPLDLDPVSAGFKAVISGHTHQPLLERRREVLYLNPGSAGHKRFSLPVSLAKVEVSGQQISAELFTLKV
jgi:putative phosphoesterase